MLSAGLLATVVVVAVAVHVGGLVLARTRAATAADHAALAAASTIAHGGDPVASARTVAVANGGRVVVCGCDDVPVEVVVEVDVPAPLPRLPGVVAVVRADARAGLVGRPARVTPRS